MIPRKDLPRIYTMYLPAEALQRRGDAPQSGGGGLPSSPLSHTLAELEATLQLAAPTSLLFASCLFTPP